MWFSKPSDAHVTPDGHSATVTVTLPAWVHIAALVLLGGLACVWWCCGQDALKNVLGILAATLAFYSAFYARKAILSARERERRFETIKYSGVFSDSSHIAARTAISHRFGQLLNLQNTGSDGDRRSVAVAIMAEELRKAVMARETEKAEKRGENQELSEKDLIDDAIVILDYFEDLAVGVEESVFDAATARKLLRSPLLSFWELLKAFVEQYRSRSGRKSLYQGMEALHQNWSKY